MSKFKPSVVPRYLALKLHETEAISFSWENSNACWFGTVLTFSDAQRACWKSLWDNFFRGNLPIPNGRILSAYPRGTTAHIYHHFKRHDAWIEQIIVGDGRGNFWLRCPDDIASRFEAHFKESVSSD